MKVQSASSECKRVQVGEADLLVHLSSDERNAPLVSYLSIWVAELLALLASDHDVPGLNPTEGGIQLMTVQRFFAQSFIIALPVFLIGL